MIAIGALGGSGTRAVAEVLIKAGIFMGDDLNEEKDNLIFTRLFKNPNWYKNSSLKEKYKRMLILQKYMHSGKLSVSDILETYKAANTNPTFYSKTEFYFRILKMLFKTGESNSIWGWKEPNTQIYMNELLQIFENLKYIHVLRNGLDMAYSNNKQQLINWGWKYNIILDGTEDENQLTVKQLNYWIESTQDILTKSKAYENRFLLINHTNFCTNPKFEIDKILEFCNVKVQSNVLENLYKIPQNMGSNDRYKTRDFSLFTSSQIQFVQQMGFTI